jgi:hypothetical protein
MPCKERLETPRYRLWLYRPCTAGFGVGSLKRLRDLAIVRTKRKDDWEPYWQDEKDWLCTVEFSNFCPLVTERLGSMEPTLLAS